MHHCWKCAVDAQAIIDADETMFMADQDNILGVDINPDLLKTPTEAMLRRTLMTASPSQYFQSKAPAMGSLSGQLNGSIVRIRFYNRI